MRKIPAKVLYSGDIERAKLLRGVGNSQLVLLEQQMKLNGLQQYELRPLRLPGGVVISCNNCFGTYTLHIHVPKGGEKEKEEIFRDCYCWPCFSQGFVIDQHVVVNVTSFGSYSYTVGICVDTSGGIDKYLMLEEMCFPIDCAQYTIGQPVMVSASPSEGEYQMCSFPAMDASWYIMVPISANIEKAPDKKWWRNSEGGRYFPPQSQ